MMPIQQLLQLIQQIAENAASSNAETGYAAGAGGNKWTAASKKAQKFKDPVASGIAGFLAGRHDKKQRRRAKREIEKARQASKSIFARGLGQQEAFSRKATEQELAGFDKAKAASALAGTSAKRGALERGQQYQARAQQDLANRGLGSISSNLGRGINADVSREVSSIDEMLGSYFGNLAMGRAGTEAAGTRDLADLASQRTNFDIQDSQFWQPYNWQNFGRLDALIHNGGGVEYGGSGVDIAGTFGNISYPKRDRSGGGGGGQGGAGAI